jgi:hypothetical protein
LENREEVIAGNKISSSAYTLEEIDKTSVRQNPDTPQVIQALLRFREQVKQQRTQAPMGQYISHVLITRAQTATTAAVYENEQGAGVGRQTQIGVPFNASGQRENDDVRPVGVFEQGFHQSSTGLDAVWQEGLQ